MGILSNLFKPKSLSLGDLTEWMIRVADELERTHRGTLSLYNEDIAQGIFVSSSDNRIANPSPWSIYKVRLFASAFVPVAHVLKYKQKDMFDTLLNMATGAAISPSRAGTGGTLSREEAAVSTPKYLMPLVKLIAAGLKSGPIGKSAALQPAHLALLMELESIFAESIGCDRYTAEIREHLSLPFLLIDHLAFVLDPAARFVLA